MKDYYIVPNIEHDKGYYKKIAADTEHDAMNAFVTEANENVPYAYFSVQRHDPGPKIRAYSWPDNAFETALCALAEMCRTEADDGYPLGTVQKWVTPGNRDAVIALQSAYNHIRYLALQTDGQVDPWTADAFARHLKQITGFETGSADESHGTP